MRTWTYCMCACVVMTLGLVVAMAHWKGYWQPQVIRQPLPLDANNFFVNFSSHHDDGTEYPTLGYVKGYLNYDVWRWVVGYLVDDLRINRDFPWDPDERGNISILSTEFDEVDPADLRGRYGHKIYGYLFPPSAGLYTFQVELMEATAAASVELWVSSSSSPSEITKVLDLVCNDEDLSKKRRPISKSAKSKELRLESDCYYFEFLEKAFEGRVVSSMKWKPPDSSTFIPIPTVYYAMAAKLGKNGAYMEGQPVVEQLRNKSVASNVLQSHHHLTAPATSILPITDLDVLPQCEFNAVYARPHKVGFMKGRWEVKESKVYPHDHSWFHNFKKADKGNSDILDGVVNNVRSLYNKALTNSKRVNGKLVEVHYMEQTENRNEGSRFLLEMDVRLQPGDRLVHTSEYVYLKSGSSLLCHTSNFQWKRDTFVHFVVSLKNLGLWVKHLIHNVEDIYEVTKDENFSLIIVDYESDDINVEEEAKKSSFKKITVLNLKGMFSRSGGLQEGIDNVTDPNSIVMTIDMHLTIPAGFLQYVRKHTIQGKMALTPMFFKLNKGYTEINLNGAWGTWSYGLNSMFKSDWTRAGRFDVKKFGNKWGNEDVDMVDKMISKGMEAFRIRVPGLVHYHHTRKGMWGNKGIDFDKGRKN